MAELVCPDVVVYVCGNCIPAAARLPRQWRQQQALVVVREVPCSGKMDAQYLLHALEGGSMGFCVVACPEGRCQLAQGNYRAGIRVATVRRLLDEIGIEPERAEFVHASPDDPPEDFEPLIREVVGRLVALGPSPVAVDTLPTMDKP